MDISDALSSRAILLATSLRQGASFLMIFAKSLLDQVAQVRGQLPSCHMAPSVLAAGHKE